MMQEPEKMKDVMKKVQLEEGYGRDNKKLEKFNKITPYLKTLPSAKTKFKKLQLQKKIESSSPPDLSDPSASQEEPFGLGSLVFPSFQRFNNIECILFLYSMLVIAHGIVFGLVDLCFKHLEKQLFLSETEKFVMDFSDYIASFLVAIPVGYYGGRGNRLKWIAAGAFILGIGSAIFAVLFYKYEIIKLLEESEELCIEAEDRTIAECGGMMLPYRSKFIYLFIFAQCLHGVSGMPIYILGLTFIYDHIPIFSAGLYI
ncbi:hypothetical protein STEG23_027566, partial [Scotinomys teguina]